MTIHRTTEDTLAVLGIAENAATITRLDACDAGVHCCQRHVAKQRNRDAEMPGAEDVLPELAKVKLFGSRRIRHRQPATLQILNSILMVGYLDMSVSLTRIYRRRAVYHRLEYFGAQIDAWRVRLPRHDRPIRNIDAEKGNVAGHRIQVTERDNEQATSDQRPGSMWKRQWRKRRNQAEKRGWYHQHLSTSGARWRHNQGQKIKGPAITGKVSLDY
jgi:hypothetical protein